MGPCQWPGPEGRSLMPSLAPSSGIGKHRPPPTPVRGLIHPFLSFGALWKGALCGHALMSVRGYGPQSRPVAPGWTQPEGRSVLATPCGCGARVPEAELLSQSRELVRDGCCPRGGEAVETGLRSHMMLDSPRSGFRGTADNTEQGAHKHSASEGQVWAKTSASEVRAFIFELDMSLPETPGPPSGIPEPGLQPLRVGPRQSQREAMSTV